MPNVTREPPRVNAQVDTLGIAVPINDFDTIGCEHRIMAEGTDRESHRWSRKLDGGGFIGTGLGDVAWIEASLPKRIDGENWEAIDLADVADMVVDLYSEAGEFLDIPDDFDPCDSRIVRLDLVRDFHDVADPTPLLNGLAVVDQPGRSKVRRFADPSANRAETLRVGPKAWGCTLYDKHTESGGKAPPGQLRFEARLHGDQLTSAFARDHGGNVGTVADLMRQSGSATKSNVYFLGRSHVPKLGAAGPVLDHRQARGLPRAVYRDGDAGQSLSRLQRAWFDRVGFGLMVAGRNELAERIAAAGLTATESAGVWSFLTLPGWASTVSRNTRAKYRRYALGLDLAPAFFGPDDIPLITAPTTVEHVRLDYDNGTLEKVA